MNKNTRWILFGLSFAFMGISMPNCPGQQAMQTQINDLQTTKQKLETRLAAVESKSTAVEGFMKKMDEALPNLVTITQQNQEKITALETQIKDITAKMEAMAKPAAGKPKKK
jgi:archaellum component FlaC